VSTNAAEQYYETMGQNWERAAMIKARAAVGDVVAGEKFLAELQPFIWRKYLDYAAIADVHSIKRQIHAQAGHGEIAVAGHDIKLGRGGIREIEFFAQTQQLILGGRIPSLREKRTIDALGALAQRAIITREAADELGEAYRFLRTLEHRLQMVEDEQTHSLPTTAEGLDNIARFMGFAETSTFEEELRARLTCVQSHYARLFESSPALSEESGSLVFTGVEDDPETIATLRRLNFSQPSAVAATIRGWHHGRVRATRSEKAREKLTALMPLLLLALGKTANPDIAFTRFDRFLSGLPSGVQVFALLYSNPRLLDLIAEIVGTAPRLADHLGRRPALLDVLIDADFLRDVPTVERLRDSLFTMLRPAKSFEERLDVVRRWTKDQQFRVGLQLLQGAADGAAAGRGFTDIADAAIVALTAVVEDAALVAHGRVAGGAMAVIAMGRLGGFEMTASSDLDLIFVYEHEPDAPPSDGPKPLAPSLYYARTSQHLITALTVMTGEGGLYEVDMRLRPSGNKGPVAVSLATFENYQATEAWTWERLALARARVIAGPPALRAKVEAAIQTALQRAGEESKILGDIADMRLRLEKERAAKTMWDLKEVPGGLFDVEFMVQGAQLLHGAAAPHVLNVNTLAALAALEAEGAFVPKDAALLRAAAKLYQSLTHVLRLAVEGEFEPTEASPSLRALIARAAGLASFEAVEEKLGDMQTQIRALFLRWVKAAPA
jgi:[glutamine synthetase] adenylyltransferase / [glutamine synthetase]-adenylyl-L-tyrosine phosphorylase